VVLEGELPEGFSERVTARCLTARFEDNRALRPPRKSSPQAGLSRQLEQSLRVMERGPRPQITARRVRPETSVPPGSAVSRGASLHGAVTEQPDVHMQCGPGGWPGPHLFLRPKNGLPRIRIRTDPKTIEWCFPRRRFPIDLRFYFTYTPT
jgi:hypothetical protein